jgi:hypothetical protein
MSETTIATVEKKRATLKEVREFFNTEGHPMSLTDMKNEWTNGGLTKDEKLSIQEGIADGSFTY